MEHSKKLPKKHDSIRGFFPPIRDQFFGGGRESEDCAAAFACLTLIEYFERLAFGTTCERSKAFVHASVRGSHSAAGRHVMSIPAALRALVRWGAPPEFFWPY